MGTRFSAPVQTGPGAHPDFYVMGTESLLGVNRWGRVANHHPHLAPRLKKESNYTSALPLNLHSVFQGEIYLYLHIFQ